jgi:rhodanese-related sulfurtransferase
MNHKKIFHPRVVDNVPEISPDDFRPYIGQMTLIDVRRPEEFNGELSHIQGATLVTLGPELDKFLESHPKEDEVVFVCRSGVRSASATLQSRAMGFPSCVNLQGGMILWNQKKFPTEKGH